MTRQLMSCCLCTEKVLTVETDHGNRRFFNCSYCGDYEVSNSAASALVKGRSSDRAFAIKEWIKETPDDQFLSISFDALKHELVFEREPRKRL